MPSRPRETQPAPGLLASALTFVAREIGSFVTAASGGEVQTDPPEASSSRVTLDGKRRERVDGEKKEKERERKAKRVRKRSEVESDRTRARRRLREEGECECTERVQRTTKAQPQSGQWEREKEREMLSEPEAADDEDDELPKRPIPKSLKKRRDLQAKNVQREDNHQVDEPKREPRVKPTDQVTADPSKPVPPPPNLMPPPPTPLTTRAETPFPTMPGSLFPRSGSLMPETPAIIRRAVPRPQTPPPPADHDEEPVEEFAGARSEESPSRGRPSGHKSETTNGDVSAAPSCVRESSQYSDVSRRVRSSSRKSVEEPFSEPTRPKSSKGKERAYDTSGEILVRGIERELLEAKEDHARNAHGRDDTDREKDKQRIRMLEEEVARLKTELALKTRAAAFLMPPPPPPPPPPMRIPIPTVSPGNKGQYLASARAYLKPTAPPVEAPINSAAYGGPRKGGKPTVNMPSDKMAAFLREMKTVRLRRVGGPVGSMGPPLFPQSAAGDVAGELTRSTSKNGMSDARRAAILGDTSFDSGVAARIFIGEKRKRDVEENIAGPSKRRETDFVRSNSAAGSSSVSSSQAESSSQSSTCSSQSSATSRASDASTSTNFLDIPPSSRSRTSSQLRRWPTRSTETELTTPSLCSDNENDRSEDKPPETPSDSGRGDDAYPLVPQERRPQSEPEIIDVDALETPPKPQKRSATPDPPIVEDDARKNAFARRPPGSPMPVKSPTKPKPPARMKTKIPILTKLPLPRSVAIVQPGGDGGSDSDDPLLMRRPRPGRSFEERVQEEVPVAGSLRTSRDRSLSTSANGRSQSNTRVATEAERTESRMSHHARRRLTLDDELRRAGDSLWQDEEEAAALPPSEPEEDLDSGQLVALGTRSSSKGFLARGGGAGSPVFMGEGYVYMEYAVGEKGLGSHSRSGSTGGGRAGGARRR